MRLRPCHTITLLLLCTLFISCAAKPTSTLIDYPHRSQQSAEGLYQAIFSASQQGKVNAEDLALARQAYAAWSLHAWAYHAEAEAGRYDTVQAKAMDEQIQTLTAIAERNKVATWRRR